MADDQEAPTKGGLHIEAIPWAMAATATTAATGVIGAATIGPAGLAVAAIGGAAAATGIWATNRDETAAVASAARRGVSARTEAVKVHRAAVRTAKAASAGRSVTGRGSGRSAGLLGGRGRAGSAGGSKRAAKRTAVAARRDSANRVKAARALATRSKARQGRNQTAALLAGPSKTAAAKRAAATGSKPLLGPTFPPPARRPAAATKSTAGRRSSGLTSVGSKRTGSTGTRPRSSLATGGRKGTSGRGRGLGSLTGGPKRSTPGGRTKGPSRGRWIPLTTKDAARNGQNYNPPGSKGHRTIGDKIRHRIWGQRAEAKRRHQAKVEKWAMEHLEMKAATKALRTDTRWAKARFFLANLPDYLACKIPVLSAQANYRLEQRRERHEAHLADLAKRHGSDPNKLGNHIGEDTPATKTNRPAAGGIITGGTTMASTDKLNALIQQAIDAQKALASYIQKSDDGMLAWDVAINKGMPELAQANATTALTYAARMENLPTMSGVKTAASEAAKGSAMVVGAVGDIAPIFNNAHAEDLERLKNPRGPEEHLWDQQSNR